VLWESNVLVEQANRNGCFTVSARELRVVLADPHGTVTIDSLDVCDVTIAATSRYRDITYAQLTGRYSEATVSVGLFDKYITFP
jgi:hypothetical protein